MLSPAFLFVIFNIEILTFPLHPSAFPLLHYPAASFVL